MEIEGLRIFNLHLGNDTHDNPQPHSNKEHIEGQKQEAQLNISNVYLTGTRTDFGTRIEVRNEDEPDPDNHKYPLSQVFETPLICPSLCALINTTVAANSQLETFPPPPLLSTSMEMNSTLVLSPQDTVPVVTPQQLTDSRITKHQQLQSIYDSSQLHSRNEIRPQQN